MSRRRIHYQIGAPALIHCEKIDEQSSFLQVPGHKYPRHDAGKVGELIQRRNRLGTRWYYPFEETPDSKRRKKKRGHKHTKPDYTEPIYSQRLKESRSALLAHADVYRELSTRHILKTYASYDRPCGSVNLAKNIFTTDANREPKLEMRQKHFTRKLSLQRRNNSDPAYLAPFGHEALDYEKCYDTTHPKKHDFNVDKSKTCLGPRPWQGNCLLCLPCPCPNCRSEPSWCLFHPKGFLMDTLCVSNLIPPYGKDNAGHIFTVSAWHKNDRKKDTVAAARRFFPNELCLDETIVEIQQSGTWDFDHPSCIFVVRTATHISVINVSLSKPDLSMHDTMRSKSDIDDKTCWGNYMLKEHTRLDLRSLLSSVPSYRPVSLACHPKYGDDYTSARFAFLSYSDHNGDQNVIHQFTVDGAHEDPTPHHISSLRYISSIDFTRTHPMCLWCAASSYVRPTLVSEVYFRKHYPLGFGTSLYSVDLRSNSSVFQWSPSAQEMKPEGLYSITGILTDWDRDHTVWVTSKSAGKTWEVDSRMPCQAVNSWSISSDCDVDSISFQQRGPYGDAALLSKIREYSDGRVGTDSNMILNMDTAPASFGFELLQRPWCKPRFQTESLECVSIPNLESYNLSSSIATSSVFAMPERDEDLFCCGLAGFRTPLNDFVTDEDAMPGVFRNSEDSTVLCTISLNNKGDMFCHSLLETSREVLDCKSFPGLPAGTAAIPLPKELDGRTKNTEHKCWKPTGGMNLKVFWTNQYPTPRDSLLHIKATTSKRIHLPTKDATDHLSYQAGNSEEPYQVKMPTSSGIQIAARSGSEFVNADGVPLVIPKKSADKAFATQLKFRTPITDQEEESKRDDIIGDAPSERRSDLTSTLVKKVANTWELWEKLDDDSSSEE